MVVVTLRAESKMLHDITLAEHTSNTIIVSPIARPNPSTTAAKTPGKAEGSYTMDHTAGSYVFDAQGRVRLFTRYGVGAKALADDLKLLLSDAA